MMNRQIRVKKLLVQLNVLVLVAQSKFKPSKREIRLLYRISFLIYSAGAVVDAVSYYLQRRVKS